MLPYIEAISSSVLFNLSVVLQTIDARKAPSALAMRPGLLFHLMRRWLWMLGNAMNVAAAVLQVLALSHLPVAVVQSIAAGGIFLVPLSACLLLKERPRVGDWIALVAIVVGLALAMVSTPPQAGRLTVSPSIVFGATFAASAAALVTALYFKRAGTLVAASLCFAASTVMSKVLALPETTGARTAMTLILLVCSGSTGFLAQTTALQTVSPARVAPLTLASRTALPIFVAPMLFAERWPQPLLTLTATLGVIAAAVYLASSRPLVPLSAELG